MPISAETAARSENAPNDHIVDQGAYAPNPHPHDSAAPSETVEPTIVTEASQQGATQPGSGTTIPESGTQPRFKEKVIGYAKEIRGTALGKSETKEQGQRIVSGEEKFEPKKVGPKASKADEA